MNMPSAPATRPAEFYREGERYAADLADHADDYYVEVSRAVRRHPAKALGVAVGVGFLLGLIIARR